VTAAIRAREVKVEVRHFNPSTQLIYAARFDGPPEFILSVLDVELMNPNLRSVVITAHEVPEEESDTQP